VKRLVLTTAAGRRSVKIIGAGAIPLHAKGERTDANGAWNVSGFGDPAAAQPVITSTRLFVVTIVQEEGGLLPGEPRSTIYPRASAPNGRDASQQRLIVRNPLAQ